MAVDFLFEMGIMFGPLIENTDEQRRTFFNLLFGGGRAEGYVCLAFKDQGANRMRQEFWHYPSDLDAMLESINETANKLTHAYFCPQLLKTAKRTKDNVITCTNAWSDLDSCSPDLLLVEPTILTMTSPGRYQALWVFDKAIDPQEAQNISLKIAYYHSSHGADQSGWDLTQLLRIPYTPNYKYGNDSTVPLVMILKTDTKIYTPKDLDVYPTVEAIKFVNEKMPKIEYVNPQDILSRYRPVLNHQAVTLFEETPTVGESWSEVLWKLINFCVEAGMDKIETFQVVWDAKCNKYKRDQRPKDHLWEEINRAHVKHIEIRRLAPTLDYSLPDLLSPKEIKRAQADETFVERYINWAEGITDASKQYHQAGAFILLSSVLSATVRLATSFGPIIPNLWFMITGPTTLCRKTTAMNIAMDLLFQVDEEIQFATDGTMEGITSGLKFREGKSSLFYRDEFTGLLTAMMTKDYMSDMVEHLTKLYDGKPIKRLLRKEEIFIRKPIFMILAGGIKEKIQSLLTEEHIVSGFIPRFVFINAEPDISTLTPIGPPIDNDDTEKQKIKNELYDIHQHYNEQVAIMRDGKQIGTTEPSFKCALTRKSWERYNRFETTMINSAIDTGLDYLTPVYDRLAKSTLKAAILIAASKQRGDKVIVEEDDLLKAIYYCRFWRDYANEMVSGVGKSQEERLIERIILQLKNVPGGITKAELMNVHRLSSKRANDLFDTMIQRRLIRSILYQGQTVFFIMKS